MIEFFVSPAGDDRGGDGSRDKPFSTLERARDELRRRRGREDRRAGAQVWLRGGRYELRTPFDLAAEDSGHPDAPVCFAAWHGERVVLSGGKPLSARQFHQADSRQVPGPKRDTRLLDLTASEAGFTGFGELSRRGYHLPVPLPPMQIYINGRALKRARWPKSAPLQMGPVMKHRGARETFALPSRLPASWVNDGNLWVEGVFAKDWTWSVNRVQSINPVAGTLTLAFPEVSGLIRTGRNPFVFDNVLEALERPGECYSSDERIMLLSPIDDLVGADIVLTVAETPLVRVEGAHNVHFRDLHLEYGRDIALSLSHTRDCRIIDCEISHFGRGGLVVKGRNNLVRGCTIRDAGGTGVSLSGGDPGTLVPGSNVLESTSIRGWGRWQKVYAPGVALSGVGQRVTGCMIAGGPHVAVEISGNDHLLHGNEIFDAVTEFRDMGAVYLNQGFKPGRRGTVIADNYLHDLGNHQEATHAIYLDNATMGVVVRGNRLARIGNCSHTLSCAIKCNGTSHVRIEGNLFLDCASPCEFHFFLNGWGGKHAPAFLKAWREFATSLESMPAHLERYPELSGFASEDRMSPDTNRFENNVVVNRACPRRHPGAVAVIYGDSARVHQSANHVFP